MRFAVGVSFMIEDMSATRVSLLRGRSPVTISQRWQAQSLEWLADDLRMRSLRMADLERQIQSAAPGSDTVLGLRAELEQHRQRIERARTGDPALESLRGLPGFAALFEGR